MARMTIRIVANNVEIEDSGRMGGNVRARVGRRIVWVRDASVATFDLKVERLTEGDGAVDTSKDWPFATVKATPAGAKVDEIDCEITGAEKVAARIANDDGVFKYTITARDATNQPFTLDPVIIVKP
jgi:hypothetical protein